MDVLICPECGMSNPVEAVVCEQCNADLSAVKSVIDTANSHFNEALAFAHAGKLDEALAQIEAALALSAQNPEFHNLEGTLYAQKGLFEDAMRCWERCISLDPEMEKAFRNIEKARQMAEDAEEEQRKRPFVMTSIIASCVAGLLLLVAVYAGSKAYFAGDEIAQLQSTVDLKSKAVSDLTEKLDALNQKFPEGIETITAKITSLQSLADERQKQIATLTEQRNKDVENQNQQLQLLRNRIQQLMQEKKTVEDQAQNLITLQAKVSASEGKEEALQRTINDRTESLKQAHADLETLRTRLNEALEEVRSTRQQRDQAIYDLNQTNAVALEKYRSETQELRDQIAERERQIADYNYAESLIVEAINHLDSNNYELANQNVQTALSRIPDHPLAVSLQADLKKILSDPVEQEIRRQEKAVRLAQREQKRNEILSSYLAQAQATYNAGRYNDTIDLTSRALALSPSADLKNQLNSIRVNAEERNNEMAMLLLEAKKDVQENRIKEARAILKRVLKLAPSHPEAQQLLTQIAAQ